MSLNFLELRPKQHAKEFTFHVYQSDFEKFTKFVEFINQKKFSEEIIAVEDVFAELMKATEEVADFSEYLVANKTTRRGRKSKESSL